jgi:hypothetical protein
LLGEKEDETQKILGKKMIRSARIVERMINQNIYNDIAQGMMVKGYTRKVYHGINLYTYIVCNTLLSIKIVIFAKTLNTGRMHLMNFVKLKELYCLYGSFLLKRLRNWK